MNWYSEQLEDVARELDTDFESGLPEEAAKERLAKYGRNKLAETPPKTFLQRFIAQMKDVMIAILLAATAVSFAINVYHVWMGQPAEWFEPIAIILIVVVNGILGVTQESRAEAALEALKKMSMPLAKVRRGGSQSVVESADLVPGDVILLEAGDVVPADARLLEGASLKSDESALTGESVPSEKRAGAPVTEGVPLGDRVNMLYSGCFITYGRGSAVVVATGMSTEMGKIASLLEGETGDVTPLQQKLAELGKYLGVAALVICAVIFAVGAIARLPLMHMFMTSVSLAVAAIPEGLPTIVTIVLAIGVRRMVAKNAIIRRLPAVETLGSTSVICSDKTGTLTQNRMTLVKAYAGGRFSELGGTDASEEVRELVRLGALCTDGKVEMSGGVERHIGDPTETSIVAAAMKLGEEKDELERAFPREGEIPFDSERKLMTTVHKMNDGYLVIVKGAPDVLFARCASGDTEAAARANEEMSGEALRVLAVGVKKLGALPRSFEPEALEDGLTLLGLLGMIDPPRPEAVASIKECDDAGIKTVMITGDHVLTASAIARRLGILREGGEALTGAELDAMTDEQLDAEIDRYRVYARVSPSNKIRIVKAWQSKGKIVAMTGDGVNDAPALKAADIGVAMGITGTDVSKGAADMILTDDSFSTIVTAVREGRGIYDNIRKAVRFLLSCNLGEIITVFVSMLIWKESPLLPIQLLWVNLVTDSFPALALGMERVEPDIMSRKPREKDESLFANGIGASAVMQGVMFGVLTLTAYYIGSRSNVENAGIPLGETMAFAVLALSQLVHAFNVRSSHSLFKIGFFSNRHMVYACVLSLTLMLTVLFVPFLRGAFGIIAMNGLELAIVAGLSAAPLLLCELEKAVTRRGAVNPQ